MYICLVLQVTMTVLEDTYQFISKQQIILDKSGCGTPPAIGPPTMPEAQPISSDTCSAIMNLNISPYLAIHGGFCQITQHCDSIVCSVTGYTLFTQLLPCHDPPTLFVQGRSTSTAVFEQTLPMASTVFFIPELGSLEYIVYSTHNYIRLQVSTLQKNASRLKPVNINGARCITIDKHVY